MFIFIDDNPVSNFFYKEIINKSTHDLKVICFENCKEALNYLTPLSSLPFKPVYLFIKMNMPYATAWEIIEYCEQLEGNNEYLNIILITKEELDVEEEIKLNKHPNVSSVHSSQINESYINDLIKKQPIQII